MRKIIAFTGNIGSGKSTASKYIIEKYGYKEAKFASGLKTMLYSLYDMVGLDHDTIMEKLEGSLKEKPCPILQNKTPRYAMQRLGSEWRDFIGANLWTDILTNQILANRYCDKIVISDYRFPHEKRLFDTLGGIVVKVVRPLEMSNERLAILDHDSEKSIDVLPSNYVIDNTKDVNNLYNEIDNIMKKENL